MQRLAGVGAGIVGLTLVTTITATVVVPTGPVAADQVSELQAQATQITQDLVLEQLQIGVYEQHYDVDTAKVQRDEAAIGSSENQIQSDANRVSRDRQRLQSEALSAYIYLDPQSDGSAALFEGIRTTRPRERSTKKWQVATSPLPWTSLHTDENGLRAERVTLEQQEAQDQSTTNQEATLTNAARQTEVQLASKQSEITGELAVAVTQQQAAQAAAAAAAVRAAQAKAAAAVATAIASRPPSPTSTVLLGGASQHAVGQPVAASLPPMRPAGRIGRQLRRRFAGGHVHGRFPIQPGDVERSGRAGRHAAAPQRPPERGDSGRPERPGHRALRCRWRATVG